MAQEKRQRKVVELSRKNRKLLEEICERYGSRKEARKDPNFVLEQLLREINERKNSVSAVLTPILADNLKPHILEYYREEQQEQKKQRRRKKPLARKKAA